jgi:hypothetical protein
MSRQLHSPWFDLPNGIWGWVKHMKLLIVQFPPFPCSFTSPWSKYSKMQNAGETKHLYAYMKENYTYKGRGHLNY